MNKRFLFVLIAIMAAGLIAVGCGDDDDGGESDEPATEQEATTTEDAESEDGESEEGSSDDSGDASGASDAAVQTAIDACKQSVGAASGLDGDTIADLEDLCEEAASGDLEEAQEAAREVCVTIAEEISPTDEVREQAVAACESLTG